MYETSLFFIWHIIDKKNYLATDLHRLSLMLKTKKKGFTAKTRREDNWTRIDTDAKN